VKKEEAASAAAAAPVAEKKKDLDDMTGAELLKLSEEMRTKIENLTTMCEQTNNWLMENSYLKKFSAPPTQPGTNAPNTRISTAERMEIISTVKKPADSLKHKVVLTRMYMKKFNMWLEKDLYQKITMRSHVEIVTYFTDNDPEKVFLEIAAKNEANKEIEDKTKKQITVNELTNYLSEKM